MQVKHSWGGGVVMTTRAVAVAAQDQAVAAAAALKLELYRAGRPYREK
jgi:hypothetical protein